MTTAPTVVDIPFTNTSGWTGSWHKVASTSTSVSYDWYNTSGQLVNGIYGFEVVPTGTTTTLHASTSGNANPTRFSNDGGTTFATSLVINTDDVIQTWDNSSLQTQFTVPAELLWTSGGGTSSSGSSVPTGSNYINSQGQLVFVISSGSPSSDGNIAYKIFRRQIGGTLTQAYVVPHTSGGTDTEFNIGLNLSLYDRWELRIESSTALVQSAVLSVHLNNKKVFCNFW